MANTIETLSVRRWMAPPLKTMVVENVAAIFVDDNEGC